MICKSLKRLFKKRESIKTPPTASDLIYETALKEIGVKEIPGKWHSERILKYLAVVNAKLEDETAWCAAFMCWVFEQCGLEHPGKATARSFLSLLELEDWIEVGIDDARKGDLVVLWRESVDSWKGHVGLLTSVDGDNLLLLGGNQNNAVSQKYYPIYRVLKIMRNIA